MPMKRGKVGKQQARSQSSLARSASAFTQRMAAICILVLLLGMGYSCCNVNTELSTQIVPIREANLRFEVTLPLDSMILEQTVAFVAHGGIKDQPSLLTEIDLKSIRGFLQLFQHQNDSILAVNVFDRQSSLTQFIDVHAYSRNVVNSCDSLEPDEATRRAYPHRGFWYVFIVDSTATADGTTIPDKDRRFSRLIVMKQYVREGEK